MKKNLFVLGVALLSLFSFVSCAKVVMDDTYVVLASEAVQQDAEWFKVAEALQQKHSAELIIYKESPCETMDALREIKPRYVAIVEKPENLGRDYVIDMHLASREIDDDIYADFVWGMITGYDAAAAMRMVDNSTEPLLVKDAVATITELNSAKWFDNYGWVDFLAVHAQASLVKW